MPHPDRGVGAEAMRLALICDAYDPAGGGAERWTARFAMHLLQAGHDVHVLTFAAEPQPSPLRVQVLPTLGGPLARGHTVARALAALAPAAAHDTGTGWSGSVFHPQTGSRLLSTNRETAARPLLARARLALSPQHQRYLWQLRRIEQRAAAAAGHVVALSHAIAARMRTRHGVPPARLSVIPNGIDVAAFAPARLAPLRAAARDRLRVGDATLFLLVAHNLRLKGIDTALQAIAMVPGAHLAVVGALPDPPWLALARQLGIADRVHWCGNCDPVQPLFAAADAMLHPTRWDACSLATLEGLAAGLPVVTTAANGAAELMRSGHDGFVLADAAAVPPLAEHVRALLDPAMRRRVGEAARRTGAAADIDRNCAAVAAVLLATAQPIPG